MDPLVVAAELSERHAPEKHSRDVWGLSKIHVLIVPQGLWRTRSTTNINIYLLVWPGPRDVRTKTFPDPPGRRPGTIRYCSDSKKKERSTNGRRASAPHAGDVFLAFTARGALFSQVSLSRIRLAPASSSCL